VRQWCWASPFDPWSFAGVQVALQAWINDGRAVSLQGDWANRWQTLTSERPEALSATPTFLDLLLQNEPAERVAWTPRQVTLGGEPLRAGLGSRLRARWPEARFTAIYAAAEFGVLLKTQRVDGWYETASLAARWAGWRVEDGVLAVNEAGTWRSTGDCVEVRGDLLRVLGRASEVANVAGSKVSLSQVSLLAEEVEGVARAVAVAEPNPVTGQVVALRFAPVPGADAAVVQQRLEARLRAALPKPAWPRRWVVAELGPDQNAKRGLQ
jgi:acyl-CoA synthetase (AMP-forming)/AMP-acid ligase II